MTSVCDFRFSLHNALNGGNQIGDTQTVSNVSVTGGRFSVVLNRSNQFGGSAFTGDARWLQVSVRCPAGSSDFSTLSPRQELLPNPYALHAASVPWSGISNVPTDLADGDADTTYTAGNGLTLNGGAFAVVFGGTGGSNAAARSDHNHGGQVWTGVDLLGLRVNLNSTDDASTALSGNVTNGAGVYGKATATTGSAYGVFGASDGPSGTAVSALHTPSTGAGFGVFGSTSSMHGTGVSGFAAAVTGDQSVGVHGSASAPGARGVVGYSTATIDSGSGVYGRSDSIEGIGISGFAAATTGIQSIGVLGGASAPGARGVVGFNYATTGSGSGVYGSTDSTNGAGVAGIAGATTGDQSVGVFGSAAAPGARGVAGVHQAVTGTGVGVYGSTNSPNGWAGYFAGDVNVTGTIFAAGKNFRIEHPLDPEHKYLNHAAVESSEMMNVYSGNATLDANGEAVVVLPDWFEALNTDFRYQLTPIGAPGPNLYIAQPIQNNQFQIAGGSNGMIVSWQVTGIRHDPFATANPLIVEEDKPAGEQEVDIAAQGWEAPPAWEEVPAQVGAYQDRQMMEAQIQELNAQTIEAETAAGGQGGD